MDYTGTPGPQLTVNYHGAEWQEGWSAEASPPKRAAVSNAGVLSLNPAQVGLIWLFRVSACVALIGHGAAPLDRENPGVPRLSFQSAKSHAMASTC